MAPGYDEPASSLGEGGMAVGMAENGASALTLLLTGDRGVYGSWGL